MTKKCNHDHHDKKHDHNNHHDHHEDNHEHNHDHSHNDSPLKTAFILSLVMNLLFVFIEYFYSQKTQSLALLGDALHNLSDVFILLTALIAQILSQKIKYKKISALISIFNCLVLFASVFYILYESFERSQDNFILSETNTIMAVAFIGIIINFGSGLLFRNHHHHNINARAAYIHLIADAAISLSVIISAFVISKTNYFKLDLILSVIISIYLFVSTFDLFKQSLRNYQACNSSSD